MDILARIKQLTLGRRLAFTKKVDKKLESFSLTRELVLEAIYNAPAIYKTVRSKNLRRGAVETQYVLKGKTVDGQFIEAKVRIDVSALIQKVMNGEELFITQNQKPIAKLVAVSGAPAKPQKLIKAGSAKGLIKSADDFDEPLEDFREYMQ